jgi:hypothetical protein
VDIVINHCTPIISLYSADTTKREFSQEKTVEAIILIYGKFVQNK